MGGAPDDLLRVLRAAEMASDWHVGQRRKGEAQEPYINHLLEVARVVGEATGGGDANLVIAALLHDAIEDCEISGAAIEAAFGADVRGLVEAVTDDKSLPKAVRKQTQIDHAPGKPHRAKLLKIADKTSNLRGRMRSPPTGWTAERLRDYVLWSEQVVRSCRCINAKLEAVFDAALAEAKNHFGV